MFEHPAAFADFYDTPAVITGTRRDGGVVRTVRQTPACCVFGGAPADQRADATAPASQTLYTVHFLRSAWRDAMPPQLGDAVTIEGYPPLLVASAPTANRDAYALMCKSTEAAA